MRETKQKMRRTAWLRTGMILSVLLLLSGIGGVVAKYATEITSEDNTVRAGAFYFTSDLLDGGKHTLAVGTNGMASVTFHLRNHADALRYAEVDIAYTVTVTEQNSDGTSAAASGGTVNLENGTGTMQAGENHDAEITVTGLSAGKTYKIEAQATSPYTATLSATVTVTNLDNEIHYDTKTTGAILEVTVWTLDYDGSISVTYGAGLIPDNTDTKMAEWTAGAQTKTVTFGNYTTHTFRFFIVGTDADSTTITVAKEAT